MPILLNARHERFAQELASGKTADEAYGLAGFKPNRGNAATLKAQQSISNRVAELLTGLQAAHGQGVVEAAKAAAISIESLLGELEEARTVAVGQKNGAAMVSATFAKAKICGLIIEKREDVTARRPVRDIDTEMERIIQSARDRAADRAGRGAGADAPGDEALPTVPGHGTA